MNRHLEGASHRSKEVSFSIFGSDLESALIRCLFMILQLMHPGNGETSGGKLFLGGVTT